ncbi:hypothetical protein U91I_01781 [alpha proteobacterium U9-1i]|nr:hypothetical protein U91I_01781 [alpha proteobacterium U9-1i]
MKTTFFAQSLAVLAFAVVSFAAPVASAGNDVEDRTAAIRLCRAEVAAQANVDQSQARFDEVRVRAHTVRVDIDLWRDGRLTNVRCDVSRDGELTVASINPALQLASAQ